MSKKLRYVLLLVVIGGALIFITASLLLGRTPPPETLPVPNGYDDLLRAAKTVTHQPDDVDALNLADLRVLIEPNAESLLLARVGLGRQCAVPSDSTIANFGAITSDMVSLKKLAQLFSAEGRLKELENQPGGAARSYADAIRLGSAMSHGGLMINRLVGIACEGVGGIPLAKLIPKLSCAETKPLVQELEESDMSSVKWIVISRNENRFARAQMGQFPNPIKFVWDLWQARPVRNEALESHELAAARLRLLTVELALRCYRTDQAGIPERLDQLVPKYLRHVPTDPFGNRPLTYRPQGTNWLLYSIGPDRVDDGGKPVAHSPLGAYLIGFDKKPPVANGDVFYNSPW
jgi:hypothetical protein